MVSREPDFHCILTQLGKHHLVGPICNHCVLYDNYYLLLTYISPVSVELLIKYRITTIQFRTDIMIHHTTIHIYRSNSCQLLVVACYVYVILSIVGSRDCKNEAEWTKLIAFTYSTWLFLYPQPVSSEYCSTKTFIKCIGLGHSTA